MMRAVAGALDDAAVMHGDGGIDQIAAERPQPRQSAILVRAGEPAVADHVGRPGSRQVCGSRSSRLSSSRHTSRNASPSPPVLDGRTAHMRIPFIPGTKRER